MVQLDVVTQRLKRHRALVARIESVRQNWLRISVLGLDSVQHDIDANGIKRKDNQAVFPLLQNAGV
jgi:hypothetical protein